MPRRHAPHQTYNCYWNGFYSANHVSEPSYFARFVFESHIKGGGRLLEIGCGNGRDAFYFLSSGVQVTGIDLSEKAISSCISHGSPGTFLHGDFSEHLTNETYDFVYSRFTLHAVDERTEKKTLANAWLHLKPGGLLFIEARTVLDELCGQGERISHKEWIHDGHYRRFLMPERILSRARNAGFSPAFIHMSRGLAPWKDQDPIVLRLVLKKEEIEDAS